MATRDIRLTAPLADSVGKDRRLRSQAASQMRLRSPVRGMTAEARECQIACAAPLAALIAHIVQVHHQHLRDQLFRAWTLLDQLAFEAPRGCKADPTMFVSSDKTDVTADDKSSRVDPEEIGKWAATFAK